MLPPESAGSNSPLKPASGDVLAAAIFYLVLALIASAGTAGTIGSLIRYADLNDARTLRHGGRDFFRREAPARRAAVRQNRPLLTIVARAAGDVPQAASLDCCVLFLLLTSDERFAKLAQDPDFSGADDLPYYILEHQGGRRTSHRLDFPGFVSGPL